MPLRPARLRRGLCRQLRDLAQRDGMPARTRQPVADISDADMRALADRARRDDGPEREAYRKAGEALGFGLGSLFALIDPAPVAMVGIGALAFDLIEPSLREAIAQTAGGQHAMRSRSTPSPTKCRSSAKAAPCGRYFPRPADHSPPGINAVNSRKCLWQSVARQAPPHRTATAPHHLLGVHNWRRLAALQDVEIVAVDCLPVAGGCRPARARALRLWALSPRPKCHQPSGRWHGRRRR